MSDQSLRDALGALAADYATIDAEQITDLLAAHPVEPAPVVTEETVERATIAWYEATPGVSWEQAGKYERAAMLARTRLILEAAAPLIGPRPMPTREQLFQYLHEVTGCICDLTEDSDWARGHRQVWYERTDKLLALLNGTEA